MSPRQSRTGARIEGRVRERWAERWVLTEADLEFRPNRLDAATGGKAWSTELAQIGSVGKEKRGRNPFNGSLRGRLRVETVDGGVQLFVVTALEQVADRIRRALPSTDQP